MEKTLGQDSHSCGVFMGVGGWFGEIRFSLRNLSWRHMHHICMYVAILGGWTDLCIVNAFAITDERQT